MADSGRAQFDTLVNALSQLDQNIRAEFLDCKNRLDALNSLRVEHQAAAVRKESFKTAEGSTYSMHALVEQVSTMFVRLFKNEAPPVTSNPLHEVEAMMMKLKSRVDTLTTEREGLYAQNAQLERKIEILAADCTELNIKLQQSKDLSNKFRGMILKPAGSDNEPIDAEIIRSVGEMRALVQTVVQKYCRAAPKAANAKDETTLPQFHWSMQQRLIKARLGEPSEPIGLQLIRAGVFDLLHKEIFEKPCFGLEKKMERQLRSFERAIEQVHSGRGTDLMEWRTRTMSLSEGVAATWTAPGDMQSFLLNFLLPFLSPRPKANRRPVQQPQAEVAELLFDLCTKAYDLALKFRRSRSLYQFFPVGPGTRHTQVDNPDFYVEYSAGPRDGGVEFEVVRTLFGGLAKYPDMPESNESVILIKAYVATRALS